MNEERNELNNPSGSVERAQTEIYWSRRREGISFKVLGERYGITASQAQANYNLYKMRHNVL